MKEMINTTNMKRFYKILCIVSFFIIQNTILTVQSFNIRNQAFFNKNIIQSKNHLFRNHQQQLYSGNNDETVTTTKSINNKSNEEETESQIITTGYSNNNKLLNALEEATKKAIETLPNRKIDLAMISISSLYDNDTSLSYTKVIPTFLKILSSLNDMSVNQIIGCTSGGIISSELNFEDEPCHSSSIETEGLPGVSITLFVLPDVNVDTFHITSNDIDDKEALTKIGDKENESYFLLFPSPSFTNNKLDELIQFIQKSYPNGNNVLGAISSTVSSLSRSRLFCYSNIESNTTYTDGCVGVSLSGDIVLHNFICQGAKAVSDTFTIIDGEDSTIKTIMLDKAINPKRTRMPRPPLAEANYIMKNDLSDDEQNYMKKVLLIGVSSDNENFVVKQVASAGMKDGSVTFPLGSININKGDKMRFYVRENSQFAKDEVIDAWDEYQSLILAKGDFVPTACLIYPTLDRGKQLFSSGGSTSSTYESDVIRTYLPKIESVSGFFSNGVLGTVNGIFSSGGGDHDTTVIHGSASSFILIGSKTKRPIYSAIEGKKAEDNTSKTTNKESSDDDIDNNLEKKQTDDNKEILKAGSAPRNELNEIIIKRREIHSGRAISVSTVEWSVADKKVYPTSILEKYVWDKEFEIDMCRERVPLANLVSQCANIDKYFPEFVDTNDWVSAFVGEKSFVIIPECKRSEPIYGSLRKRYNVQNLVKQYISSNAKSISINVDQTLFGGSIDDLKLAKSISNTIPILASDLILYPYQLYRLRLAGADAIYFLVAALMNDYKDLFYLVKITKALKMQTVLSVTTKAQIQILVDNVKQFKDKIDCLILSNRNLETFDIDETGAQVLELAGSNELKEFRNVFGEHVPILAEGKIGLIGSDGITSISENPYIQKLKDTGVLSGAIVASGLVSAMATSVAVTDDSDGSDDGDSTSLNFIL